MPTSRIFCASPLPLPCGRRVRLIVVFVALAASVSCSAKVGDKKPLYPVRGKVFVKEKPAVGAFVLFVPENEVAESKDSRPHGEVDAEGAFVLSTYGSKDGAPPGKYIVLITWTPNTRESDDREDRLQGRYNDAKQPRLRATVKEEPNELPAYQLK